jgi:hypothetical protein
MPCGRRTLPCEPFPEERLYWQPEGALAGKGRIEYLWKSQEGYFVQCGQAPRSPKPAGRVHCGRLADRGEVSWIGGSVR